MVAGCQVLVAGSFAASSINYKLITINQNADGLNNNLQVVFWCTRRLFKYSVAVFSIQLALKHYAAFSNNLKSKI